MQECADAIASIQTDIGELDSAVIGAAVGVFAHEPPAGLSAQQAQEKVVDLTKNLAAATTKLVEAALKDPNGCGAGG